MKKVNLDSAAPAVKKFVKSLPVSAEGVELELNGRVFAKIVPPAQLSDAEKDAYLAEVKDMLRRSRERNKGVTAQEIERDIRAATKTVRRKR